MSLQIGRLENAQPNLPKVTEVFVDPSERFIMAELQNGKKVILAEVASRTVLQEPKKRGRKKKSEMATSLSHTQNQLAA